jgi:hypothetical protein
MRTRENIEKIYAVFNKYQLNGKIEKCPCGCISNEEEQKIYSTTLMNLSADDLGFYNRKAMSTWGNIENYKHFLPRIIEIYKENKTNGWIDLDTIYDKLEYAKWIEWNKEEQNLISKLIEIDWTDLVNNSDNEISLDSFESYSNFIDVNSLIQLWEFPKNKIALKNFVEFFYINNNEFIYPEKNHYLYEFLKKDNLIEELENDFFL